MSKMVRRNADDKLKLIKMVHSNPILWDSRLPNFKGADEEKSRAWQSIGNEFGVPGRRVARAFKSLRESYRRELALVKTMGEGFQPKWTLYTAMDFLRDVIRERKNVSNVSEPKTNIKGDTNISKNSINHSSVSSVHDDYSFFVKNEIDHDLDINPDNRITSTHNGGNSDDMDDNTSEDSHQVMHHHHHNARASQQHHHHHQANSTANGNEIEELEAIDADFPYPLIIDNSPENSPSTKRKRRNSFSDDDAAAAYDQSQMKLQPTIREVLNSKFCGFITAKLNSMEDSEADNLMNRILMLLVQTQNEGAK